jgi:hypothetical protein
VEGSRNTRASKRLLSTILNTACHESRHLNLSELNILATVVSEGNIGNCRTTLQNTKRYQNVRPCHFTIFFREHFRKLNIQAHSPL